MYAVRDIVVPEEDVVAKVGRVDETVAYVWVYPQLGIYTGRLPELIYHDKVGLFIV